MIHQAMVGGGEEGLPWQPPAPDLPRPAGTGTEGEGNKGRTDGQEERKDERQKFRRRDDREHEGRDRARAHASLTQVECVPEMTAGTSG